MRRSLRKYEASRVVVTLDNGHGVRGFVHRVYRDHVALVESQGMVPGPDGDPLLEAVQPGVSAIPISRVVRILTVPE
jgi:hypothetical protein